MASRVKKDPLSRYFQDLDDIEISSSEDSDSDVEGVDKISGSASPISASAHLSKANALESVSEKVVDLDQDERKKPQQKKLPSALDCLKNQISPAFLRLNQQKEVDWDKNIKTIDLPEGESVDFKTNAVPPPTSYEPVADFDNNLVDKDGNKKRKGNDDEHDHMTPSKAYKVNKDEEVDNS